MATNKTNIQEKGSSESSTTLGHTKSNTSNCGINEVGNYLFSNKNIEVIWLKKASNYMVRPQTIIVNLGVADVPIIPNQLEKSKATLLKQPKVLHQWHSGLFTDVTIVKADFVILIRDNTAYHFKDPLLSRFYKFENQNKTNLPLQNITIREEVTNRDWDHISLFAPNLLDMALWRTPLSKVRGVETLKFDPYFALGQTPESDPDLELEFSVTNYLWFAPEQTNCGIHDHYFAEDDPNKDPFIEIHTQISGLGRMIKYMNQKPTSQYEDVRMEPGRTHPVFCNVVNQNNFVYPWHQYYSDTDCVWMVTELRPLN